MLGKMVFVDYNKCRPRECGDGHCEAVKACERNLLVQEKEHEIPLTSPVKCRGCSDCIRACPLNAIRMSQA